MKKILIVEDEWKIRRLMKDYLVKEEYEVDEASNGEEGLVKFSQKEFDLILLDVMMPVKDGWEVAKEIRERSNIPIIMLTARSEESDQLFGYELGIDEYMIKPFNPKLLVAKIKAILRRDSSGNDGKDGEVILGSISINMDKREVKLDGVLIELTPKELDLLNFFMENNKNPLSREKILNSVWGWDYFGDERTVDTHVKRLRKKIGENYIQTVRGFGYKMEV
ncbi:MAG: response regulator transcription factor [Cetobacterium sp.]|uniref:response regulator transcription factor n=1 Tax=Cetobacterium sp. TaxID=2071632 RepID=UPI002FC9BF19